MSERETTTITIRLTTDLVDWIEAERERERRPSRQNMIEVLLAECRDRRQGPAQFDPAA